MVADFEEPSLENKNRAVFLVFFQTTRASIRERPTEPAHLQPSLLLFPSRGTPLISRFGPVFHVLT